MASVIALSEKRPQTRYNQGYNRCEVFILFSSVAGFAHYGIVWRYYLLLQVPKIVIVLLCHIKKSNNNNKNNNQNY